MNNLFLYRKDFANPGDIWSSPIHYLDDNWRGMTLDVDKSYDLENKHFDTVFIGGGALFTIGNYIYNIQKILETVKFNKLVYWGVGRGLTHDFPFVEYIPDLASSREWEPDYFSEYVEWVPCASVLHPLIEKYINRPNTKDFLVLNHWKRSEILFPAEHTKMNNKPQTIEQMLEVIAAHKWVLTTSYHAAYWATLLNKRVIVLQVDNPDNKFRGFKHRPVVVKKFNWETVVQAKNYPNAYEECLYANLRFRDKVYNL